MYSTEWMKCYQNQPMNDSIGLGWSKPVANTREAICLCNKAAYELGWLCSVVCDCQYLCETNCYCVNSSYAGPHCKHKVCWNPQKNRTICEHEGSINCQNLNPNRAEDSFDNCKCLNGGKMTMDGDCECGSGYRGELCQATIPPPTTERVTFPRYQPRTHLPPRYRTTEQSETGIGMTGIAIMGTVFAVFAIPICVWCCLALCCENQQTKADATKDHGQKTPMKRIRGPRSPPGAQLDALDMYGPSPFQPGYPPSPMGDVPFNPYVYPAIPNVSQPYPMGPIDQQFSGYSYPSNIKHPGASASPAAYYAPPMGQFPMAMGSVQTPPADFKVPSAAAPMAAVLSNVVGPTGMSVSDSTPDTKSTGKASVSSIRKEPHAAGKSIDRSSSVISRKSGGVGPDSLSFKSTTSAGSVKIVKVPSTSGKSKTKMVAKRA